jgi:hypothetical protein
MSLDQIALRHGTDKSSAHHNYTPIYEKYFSNLRNEPITLLELGHGGYQYYDRGGESAKTWRDYFHKGNIISIDIYPKQPIDGIQFYQGSQDDPEFLTNLIKTSPDIIIDDGCHRSPESIKSFEILFPLLKKGGIYCWEDLEASYWKVASDGQDFGGGIDNPKSSMNYLKSLTDEINSGHSGLENRFGITSIHFYQKLVFIHK